VNCHKQPLTHDEAKRRAKGGKKAGKLFIAYKCPQCHAFHIANRPTYQPNRSDPYQRKPKYGSW